jgi:hypothetical protein
MVGGGIGAAMLGFAFLKRPEGDDSDAATALDTIDLQRREGWNAGHPDKALAPRATTPSSARATPTG